MLLWSLCLTYYWASWRSYETTQKATQSQSEVIQYDLRKLLKRFGNKKGGVNNNSRSSNNIYTRCNNNTNMNDLVCIHCNWVRLWFESYGWKQVFGPHFVFSVPAFVKRWKLVSIGWNFQRLFQKLGQTAPKLVCFSAVGVFRKKTSHSIGSVSGCLFCQSISVGFVHILEGEGSAIDITCLGYPS